MKVVYPTERICPNGWRSPEPHDYTGGCSCEREAGHKGRCRCDCGSTSTTTPPPGWVGSALAVRKSASQED